MLFQVSWLLIFVPVLSSSASTQVVYKVGVLMASRLDSPFDLERCGPAVDLALDKINEKFLAHHGVELQKVQGSYPSCSGAIAPGLAADMHFKDDVIAFIGPACAFALEPVARLAAYWNTPIITGMGDQFTIAYINGDTRQNSWGGENFENSLVDEESCTKETTTEGDIAEIDSLRPRLVSFTSYT
ncbi:unnamed protein product [Arctia plantaginis]|uniref:Receptor ligand binding region domain-containing protein n=1 Tax=Arctia plantaginis TaxID=874455 RepID=A0A8S1B0D6_ARCPL|nr:unnamed protein product [Arctia plantaginis]